MNQWAAGGLSSMRSVPLLGLWERQPAALRVLPLQGMAFRRRGTRERDWTRRF
jgi:hypothetical protein